MPQLTELRAADGSALASGRASAAEALAAVWGLAAVQVVVGYEWLMSGATKVVRGRFPSGLAEELTEKSRDAAPWYRDLLFDTIVPYAKTFGVLIEIAELLIGVALIVTAVVVIARWQRLSLRGRAVILWTVVVAALAGLFMAVNFHLASGGTHPWLVPKDGFDEGIDLDSLLPLVQVALVAVCIRVLWLQRGRRSGTAPEALHSTR
jgi:uncharacterized membrane protein YphA (DoxX/SURF4 family)